MTKWRLLLNDAEAALAESGAPDARLDAEWMLAKAMGLSRLTMLTSFTETVTEAQATCFYAMLSRRLTGEPLQYVLGDAEFMGHTFLVDTRVLIPRCDTETLCEAAIARLCAGKRMLDIGTGSGAVAISAALACPEAFVYGVDISKDALTLAAENGRRLGAKVVWVLSDLSDALEDRSFDIIVSNPPYIPSGALTSLQREVQREPSLALDGGVDGLDFYRRIAEELPKRLILGGSLLLEVGDGQAPAVSAMLAGHFTLIRTLRDLSGLERVVTGDGYAG